MTSDEMQYVKERMDEKEFYATLVWAGARATIAMLAIFGIGFLVIPSAVLYATPGFCLSLIATVAVMLYVFRTDLATTWGKVGIIAGAVAYFLLMYIGGEVIFFGLVLLGVLIVALFLTGDAIITGVLTYRDLLEWVKATKQADEYRREQEAKKAAKEAGA